MRKIIPCLSREKGSAWWALCSGVGRRLKRQELGAQIEGKLTKDAKEGNWSDKLRVQKKQKQKQKTMQQQSEQTKAAAGVGGEGNRSKSESTD